MVRNAMILVLAGWLSFWWGHYIGELNAAGAWLAAERNDLQALLLLKRAVDTNPTAAQVLATQIDAKKTEVDQLEEAKRFSVIHFVLFPVLGPIRRLFLATL